MRSSSTTTPRPSRVAPRPGSSTLHGFSLIELMIALAIGVLLATWAYPSFQAAILKARRSTALAHFAQLQMAQERHRSNHPVYATLSQLGMPTSPDGRYQFSEEPPTTTGFNILASAQGGQAADVVCRHLGLQVDGLDTRWKSGPDAALGNAEPENRRCWGH